MGGIVCDLDLRDVNREPSFEDVEREISNRLARVVIIAVAVGALILLIGVLLAKS
jgi:hypothetical protein